MADHAAALGSRLIRRGDAAYETARAATVWRENKPERFPQAVVRAESREDVIAAVKLAQQEGLKVGVRSGGHSWTSPHLRAGSLLIDMGGMLETQIDPSSRSAWVAPAVKGRKLNDALGDHGMMAPTGHHDTVACGGFLMCGGFGWNFRHWGAGCANVTAVEVVTADGELIRADETQNQDYFWAARGAGAGFFGVVTRFQVKAYPRPKAFRTNAYVFHLDAADEAMAWMHEIAPQMPSYVELVAAAYSYDERGDWAPTRLVLSALAFADTEAQAHEVRALFDTCPVKDRAVGRRDNQPTTLEERYEGATAADPPGNRYAADNIYSDAPAAEIVPLLRPLLESMPTPRSHVFWMYQGPKPDLRGMALSAWGETYIGAYSIWSDPAQDAVMDAWPVEAMRRLDSIANGEGQMNDENMQGRPIRYLSPEAEAKLEVLRRRHDPDERFLSFLR